MASTSAQNHNDSSSVNLSHEISELMERFLRGDHSDVTFIVENTRVPAHKNILSGRSEYFFSLLSGGLAESSQNEIELKEVPLEPFKAILRYLYTGRLLLNDFSMNEIIGMFQLTDLYGFESLKERLLVYLKRIISVDNCWDILEAAYLHSLQPMLVNQCMEMMDLNAVEILKHAAFKELSELSLCNLLKRDTFIAPEIDIFQAVHEWLKHNTDADAETVLSFIRWPLMTVVELINVVQPSKLLGAERMLHVIEEKVNSSALPYRYAYRPEKNVASARFNAKTIQGMFLNGCTYHYFDNPSCNCIVVELETACLVNCIKLLLGDDNSYSYFIEVSLDELKWEKVIDYTDYHCRSWQHLYFDKRPIRYIRLTGTRDTNNTGFFLVAALQALYRVSTSTEIFGGIIMPTTNVATDKTNTIVPIGINSKMLINGKTNQYDATSGFTSHFIHNYREPNHIMIQLQQPYIINSMRLLLWDRDPCDYSFFIETSTDKLTWEMAVDKRDGVYRSWQSFEFCARPVVYIKIKGTRSTDNAEFRCVHFECPKQHPPSKESDPPV